MALVCALAGLVWWIATRPRPVLSPSRGITSKTRQSAAAGRGYVGDRACRDCHPGQTAAHSRSGHSHTLRPAAETELARWLDGQRLVDPEYPDAIWSYSLRDGVLMAERSQKKKLARYSLDYAFGSGHQGVTFVTVIDPEPRHPEILEHRLSYLSASKSLKLTPGQTTNSDPRIMTPAGRHFTGPDPAKCFGCHSTLISSRNPMTLDVNTLIPDIGCERCHGPGKEHIEQARRGEELSTLPQSPGTWSAADQMKACGECHRHPSALSPQQLRADNRELARFQPASLMMSACYTRSQGELSCVSCHDPHARASNDKLAYQAVCLSCHQAPDRPVCPVSARSGCLGCHMPQRDAGQGVLFTDHWIRIREREPAQPGD